MLASLEVHCPAVFAIAMSLHTTNNVDSSGADLALDVGFFPTTSKDGWVN